MMPTTPALRQLLDLFVLDPVGADHFVGQSLDLGFRNLFGGHILGQSLVAAGNTCADRDVHSLHAYFIRGGDPRAPIHYHVERVRDGHSFSVRRVVASQADKPILVLSASFQVDEGGFEHQDTMPEVPAPEDVAREPSSRRPVPELIPTEGVGSATESDLAIEIRPIDPMDRYAPTAKPPHQCVWFRAAGTVPSDRALHKCLLAYASDFGLLGTSLRPHAATYYEPDMVTASLDHAMWFYRDFRIDDWLLYVCDSPRAARARGLNHGRIFTRDGQLVACTTQEGLIRKLPPKVA